MTHVAAPRDDSLFGLSKGEVASSFRFNESSLKAGSSLETEQLRAYLTLSEVVFEPDCYTMIGSNPEEGIRFSPEQVQSYLDIFEPDRQAALQQISELKALLSSDGDHPYIMALCEAGERKLSAVRDLLTDPERRAAYDHQIRENLDEAKMAAEVAAPPVLPEAVASENQAMTGLKKDIADILGDKQIGLVAKIRKLQTIQSELTVSPNARGISFDELDEWVQGVFERPSEIMFNKTELKSLNDFFKDSSAGASVDSRVSFFDPVLRAFTNFATEYSGELSDQQQIDKAVAIHETASADRRHIADDLAAAKNKAMNAAPEKKEVDKPVKPSKPASVAKRVAIGVLCAGGGLLLGGMTAGPVGAFIGFYGFGALALIISGKKGSNANANGNEESTRTPDNAGKSPSKLKKIVESAKRGVNAKVIEPAVTWNNHRVEVGQEKKTQKDLQRQLDTLEMKRRLEEAQEADAERRRKAVELNSEQPKTEEKLVE